LALSLFEIKGGSFAIPLSIILEHLFCCQDAKLAQFGSPEQDQAQNRNQQRQNGVV
jgi:hypothetical protein